MSTRSNRNIETSQTKAVINQCLNQQSPSKKINEIQLIGAKINDYSLVKQLSENPIHEVFLAQRRNKQQRVFIVFKQFNNYLTQAIEKIYLQQHNRNLENVITVEDYYPFKYQGQKLYVAELKKADQDLCQFYPTLLKKSRQEQQQLKFNMMTQATLGVQELHQNKIIHRDIKPDNILMIGENAFIGDLGLIKILSEEDRPSRINSKVYSAPELYTQGQNYTFSVDIYSLGRLFLYILFGAPDEELLKKKNLMNTEIGTTILKMISQEAAKRPSIEDVLQTLTISDPLAETQKIKGYQSQ